MLSAGRSVLKGSIANKRSMVFLLTRGQSLSLASHLAMVTGRSLGRASTNCNSWRVAVAGAIVAMGVRRPRRRITWSGPGPQETRAGLNGAAASLVVARIFCVDIHCSELR